MWSACLHLLCFWNVSDIWTHSAKQSPWRNSQHENKKQSFRRGFPGTGHPYYPWLHWRCISFCSLGTYLITWSFDMCKDVWAVFWGKLSNCETLAVLLRCVLVVVLERLQLVPGSIVLDWGTGQLCIVMLVESSCFQLACFCSVSPFASTPSYRCVANVNVCFHPCYGASTLAHFSIF